MKHGVVGRKVERDDMMYKEWERNKENGWKETKVMEEMASSIMYDRLCAGTSVHSTFH